MFSNLSCNYHKKIFLKIFDFSSWYSVNLLRQGGVDFRFCISSPAFLFSIYHGEIDFAISFSLLDVTITRGVTLIEYSSSLLNAFCVKKPENQRKTTLSIEEC